MLVWGRRIFGVPSWLTAAKVFHFPSGAEAISSTGFEDPLSSENVAVVCFHGSRDCCSGGGNQKTPAHSILPSMGARSARAGRSEAGNTASGTVCEAAGGGVRKSSGKLSASSPDSCLKALCTDARELSGKRHRSAPDSFLETLHTAAPVSKLSK